MIYGITPSQFKVGFWNGFNKIMKLLCARSYFVKKKRISSFSNHISPSFHYWNYMFSCLYFINMTFFQKEARNQMQVIFLLLVLICNKCSEKIVGNLFQKFIKEKNWVLKKRSSFGVYSKVLVHENHIQPAWLQGTTAENHKIS